jgi:hypothetical protein
LEIKSKISCRDCISNSKITKQGEPKRSVAHAATRNGEPTKQNQPAKPLSANVAHAAIVGTGSLDETVNKTRFEVSPEVDAVHSNSKSKPLEDIIFHTAG